MRCQRAGIRHADRQPLERFDFVGERHGFCNAFGFCYILMHRPVDKQLIQATHHHDQFLAFLLGKNDVITGGETEVDIARDQRANVRSAAVGRRNVHLQFFIREETLVLCQKHRGHRVRDHGYRDLNLFWSLRLHRQGRAFQIE